MESSHHLTSMRLFLTAKITSKAQSLLNLIIYNLNLCGLCEMSLRLFGQMVDFLDSLFFLSQPCSTIKLYHFGPELLPPWGRTVLFVYLDYN